MKDLRPAYKWVGGKTQLADVLSELAPSRFEVFYEPFCGGAAYFFKLLEDGKITSAILSDLNEQLIITLRIIRDMPDTVISLLESPMFTNTEKNYYAVRAWDRTENWQSWIEDSQWHPFVAARLIYLTKLSFNGLWRVNKKGQHNAPYCKDESKNIVDESNIYAVSKALNEIVIGQASYAWIAELWEDELEIFAQHGFALCPTDFVYFDPPYVKSWSDYTSDGWNMSDLERVAATMDLLTNRGTYAMCSMKDTPEVRELFKGYRIVGVTTNCMINSDASNRKNGMSELIIMNYDENDNVISLRELWEAREDNADPIKQ